ncbi:hypothetical protein KSS87_000913 [Heliosperma pusillum]|nr:hypothetical protein KSS87_000913 [Heliosperma pusillum]
MAKSGILSSKQIELYTSQEKAFDEDGKLKQPKQVSINKVGHALHELDPVFKGFSCSETFARMLSSLNYKRPAVVQSMYIFKQPGIGGEVVPHQDNSFLYTDPPTCTGLWLALEDATVVNGCLWAIPGSHKNGLVRRFIRDDAGVHFDRPSPSYASTDFVPIEVKAGSLVVIHGDLIHQSFENQSPNSRHAYSLHVVDTEGCNWASDNCWLRLHYSRCALNETGGRWRVDTCPVRRVEDQEKQRPTADNCFLSSLLALFFSVV